MLIPTILIQDDNGSGLKAKISLCDTLELVSVLNHTDHLPQKQQKVPDRYFVIDVNSLGIENSIATGLSLRNAGQQVILSSHDDFEDLLELLTDIHLYTSSLSDVDAPFRTEVLITKNALEFLGNVTQAVEKFEREHTIRRH